MTETEQSLLTRKHQPIERSTLIMERASLKRSGIGHGHGREAGVGVGSGDCDFCYALIGLMHYPFVCVLGETIGLSDARCHLALFSSLSGTISGLVIRAPPIGPPPSQCGREWRSALARG